MLTMMHSAEKRGCDLDNSPIDECSGVRFSLQYFTMYQVIPFRELSAMRLFVPLKKKGQGATIGF
ncbi:MAG TPA: hypothetical protein VKT82_00915 [Ktedonobacterales bacterium]|nr:hypothetical protein [Ktedonobacterales bacterium]